MTEYGWLFATLFLPLFPLAMVFNFVFQRAHNSVLRVALLLLWPMVGLWLLDNVVKQVPQWVMYWALASVLLYSVRMLVVREVGIWVGFLATAGWGLVWLSYSESSSAATMVLHVMAFSLPLVLLISLVMQLERFHGSVFAGVVSGVAQNHPRVAGLIAISVLAAIGTPLFPAFFSMLIHVAQSMAFLPVVTIGIGVVWLLWSWSGVRLLQELLVGAGEVGAKQDITIAMVALYAFFLVLIIAAGVYFLGRML